MLSDKNNSQIYGQELYYIIAFRYKNKKIFLHVASECYVPFNIGIAYKKNFVFRNIFSNFILQAQQSGLVTKIIKDIEWEITQKSGVRNVSESYKPVIT